MARQQMVIFMDDIDGSEEGVRTIRFGFDGISYEIDLGPANYAKFKEAMAPYIEKGQKVGNVRHITSARSARASHTRVNPKELNAAIRAWVRDNGFEPAARGRIPEDIVAAYQTRDVAALDKACKRADYKELAAVVEEPKKSATAKAVRAASAGASVPKKAPAKAATSAPAKTVTETIPGEFKATETEKARDLLKQANDKGPVKRTARATKPAKAAPKGAARADALVERLAFLEAK